MPEQVLHRADVVAVLEQVRRERVARRVAAYVLDYQRGVRRLLHSPNHAILVDVVPADHADLSRHPSYASSNLIFRISRSKCVRLKEVSIPHLKTGQVRCYYSGQLICSRQWEKTRDIDREVLEGLRDINAGRTGKVAEVK